MSYQEAILFGGTIDRQQDSVTSVSFWTIPRGTDYSNAHVSLFYFNDQEKAKQFANKYSGMPEMAVVVPIDTDI
jgi:hypothetical protein